MVLLDTGTPGSSRESFSEDADGDLIVTIREALIAVTVP